MSDPYSAQRLYRVQYEAAVKDFDDGKMEECVAAAKYNLTDSTLPPFYIIKNCILIASALDDWEDADVWRLAAEQAYTTNFYEATQKQDANSLKALQDLRAELDELKAFREEDMAIGDEGANDYDMDAADENEDAVEFEDEVAVAMVENEDEVAAETFDLPIRFSSEPDIEPPAENAPTTPSTAKGKLRRQKSVRFNKGGAFHAQAFAKSLTKPEAHSSSRPSLLDVDWTPKDDTKE